MLAGTTVRSYSMELNTLLLAKRLREICRFFIRAYINFGVRLAYQQNTKVNWR